jgi:hypothetical protein
LWSVLLSETHLVRGADFDLIGIYLSYCGWMAIPLTILKWKVHRRVSMRLGLLLAAQICGNLLFIDRTRPVWIAFVSILVLFPFVRKPSLSKLLLPLGAIGGSARRLLRDRLLDRQDRRSLRTTATCVPYGARSSTTSRADSLQPSGEAQDRIAGRTLPSTRRCRSRASWRPPQRSPYSTVGSSRRRYRPVPTGVAFIRDLFAASA